MIRTNSRSIFLGATEAAVAAALLLPGSAAADSVTLSWTAPGDDGNSGRAASYELRYSDQPITGQDTLSWWNAAPAAVALPVPQAAGARESFTVPGLTTGLTYYFVIRTSDEVPNVAGFSNVSARQVGTSALATPTAFDAQSGTSGVTLSWQEPVTGGGEGYHLYRRTGTTGPDSLVHTSPLGETTWLDANVSLGNIYEYRIASYLGSLESPPATATVTVGAVAIAEGATSMSGYPNPARSNVTLRFRAETKDGSPGRARINIFDNQGHRISKLLDEEVPPGERTIQWLCRADNGTPVAPGVYNVILDGPEGRTVVRVAIVP